jgi:cytoskeletal protein RodZ
MTDQLILGTAAVVVALLVAYEVIETWRWRGYGNRPLSRFRVIRFFRRAIGGFFSIVTLRRWRRRRVEPAWTMSSEDVARRLGDAPPGPVHMQPGRIVVSGAAPVMHPPMEPAQPIQPVQPMREPRSPRPSRLRLARDTIGAALVLGGFIVVFANVVPSGPPGPPESSVLNATATPRPSAHVVVPGTPAPATASPLSVASFPPDQAPVPTQTVLVSSTPSPTPRPTARPTSAPAAAPTPAPVPTPKPTAKPTKKPPPPTPKPAARILSFAASSPASAGQPVTFTFTASNATTYTVDYDDGSAPDSGAMTGGTVHTFADQGAYTVVLTVSGPGGSDSQPLTINVQ